MSDSVKKHDYFNDDDWTLSLDEASASLCKHYIRNDTGDDTIGYKVTGNSCKCEMCGKTFNIIDPGSEQLSLTVASLSNLSNQVINALQTMKLMGLNKYVNLQSYRDYSHMIGYLEKLPKLFEFVAKKFYEDQDTSNQYKFNKELDEKMLNNAPFHALSQLFPYDPEKVIPDFAKGTGNESREEKTQ